VGGVRPCQPRFSQKVFLPVEIRIAECDASAALASLHVALFRARALSACLAMTIEVGGVVLRSHSSGRFHSYDKALLENA
jgi:hypothetical protein